MERRNMTTLCYIEKDDSYLMLHRVKKTNDMNKDKWLGIGGHFEPGESPEECLLREVKEETGLSLTSYQLRGFITFVSDRHPAEYMFLYTADGYTGDMIQCREGNLEWVKKKRIPELKLWEGDLIFFMLLEDRLPCFSLKLGYEGDKLIRAALNGRGLELLDERNRTGEVTGRVQARIYIHRTGIFHGSSHVWIVRPNKKSGFDLLLQKRSQDKEAYPLCYDISSAGHILAGRNYLETAIRELKEELGIEARGQELFFAGTLEEEARDVFYGKPFINREISYIYVYEKTIDSKKLVLQKEEVLSVMWMDYSECVMAVRENRLPHCINLEELNMLGQWWKNRKGIDTL